MCYTLLNVLLIEDKIMKKIKILIVEDEIDTANAIKENLEKINYTVTDITTNYNDTLHSVHKEIPNIVLMDILLNGTKNGIDAAKSIQKIKRIPIIFLTACNDDYNMAKALDISPCAYLTKPIRRRRFKSCSFLSS